MSLRAHRFHHFLITFRVFLSGESEKPETSGILWWMAGQVKNVYCSI